MASAKNIALLLCCLAAGCSAGIVKSQDPFVSAFKDLPEGEREDFLAYVLALAVIDTEQGTLRRSNVIEVKSGLVKEKFFIPDALGIDDNLVEKFNALNIPEESRRKLLLWTKQAFNFRVEDVKTLLVKKQVCVSGVCYDYPDLGGLCCPW